MTTLNDAKCNCGALEKADQYKCISHALWCVAVNPSRGFYGKIESNGRWTFESLNYNYFATGKPEEAEMNTAEYIETLMKKNRELIELVRVSSELGELDTAIAEAETLCHNLHKLKSAIATLEAACVRKDR